MLSRSTLLIIAAMAAVGTEAFAPTTSRVARHTALSAKTDQDDFPQDEAGEYTGSVDWDAEWKKVVAGDASKSSTDRPGQGYYKSEAEIAAIRAANRATQEATNVGSKIRDITPDINIRSLSGDWKFWIGILAIISIGLSVLSAPSNMATPILPTGGDSYYI